jgi:hypothetical protein
LCGGGQEIQRGPIPQAALERGVAKFTLTHGCVRLNFSWGSAYNRAGMLGRPKEGHRKDFCRFWGADSALLKAEKARFGGRR